MSEQRATCEFDFGMGQAVVRPCREFRIAVDGLPRNVLEHGTVICEAVVSDGTYSPGDLLLVRGGLSLFTENEVCLRFIKPSDVICRMKKVGA